MGWPLVAAAGIAAGSNLVGGLVQGQQAKSAAKTEYQRQKEFAQMGIRWKVADAIAAGIHPLAALGSNILNYSPQHVGGSDYGISKMGQDISRAIRSTQTDAERKRDDLQNKLLIAQIRNMEIKNMKEMQGVRTVLDPPPFPSSGMDNVEKVLGFKTNDSTNYIAETDLTKVVPKELTSSHVPGIEVGANPLEEFVIESDLKDGLPIAKLRPTQEKAEILESSWADSVEYTSAKVWDRLRSAYYFNQPDWKNARIHRNSIRYYRKALKDFTKQGYEWRWRPFKGGYKLRPIINGKSMLYDVDPKSYNAKWTYWGND